MAGKIAWTPERIALLQRLHGIESSEAIGARLGITGSAVRQYTRRTGLATAWPIRNKAAGIEPMRFDHRPEPHTGPLAALLRAWT